MRPCGEGGTGARLIGISRGGELPWALRGGGFELYRGLLSIGMENPFRHAAHDTSPMGGGGFGPRRWGWIFKKGAGGLGHPGAAGLGYTEIFLLPGWKTPSVMLAHDTVSPAGSGPAPQWGASRTDRSGSGDRRRTVPTGHLRPHGGGEFGRGRGGWTFKKGREAGAPSPPLRMAGRGKARLA